MSYQTFIIFTQYTGIICTVNAHIEVAIYHSVSECQIDESGEFAIFFTKSVAMAMSRDFHNRKKRSRLIICTENTFIR